jgi:hypothetical protein
VAFNRAIPLGSVVTVEAKVSRAFKVRWRFYRHLGRTENLVIKRMEFTFLQ